uniref:Protocadherin 2 alpha a 1 n=1 Tax=Sinocyclocheilus anshuiensis TaxID=1608454 RepID=A0A671PAY9_9TELE
MTDFHRRKAYVTVLLFFSAILDTSSAVTHYSILEEMEEGSVVANLASDLGLDVKTLSRRQMRLDIRSNKKYLDVNKETGELFILEKMDREYLCSVKTATCFIKMEVILENPNPIRMFNIELEIMDINDNAPRFRRDTMHLDISEATTIGERFSLTNAVDPDTGSNSVKTYYLSESDHFSIEIQTGRDGSKFADLILKKSLDREKQASRNLILTAVDGGVPARSGTASIIVRVLDTNDNAPQFDKDSYNINLTENAPIGSLVVKLNATDKDEGTNSDIFYSFSLYTSEKTQQTFSLNPDNGEIRVKEMINYEDFRIYDMEIIATDKGANSLSGKCKVKILITDMNDNHPEISIKSFSSPVKEDIPVNTVIAVVSVSDKDSEENGQVDIHISDDLPFALKESSDNYYELLVSEPLDREKVPEYDITITVTDRGNPSIHVDVTDVNDNSPTFAQSPYAFYVVENNKPGIVVFSVSAADIDEGENARVSYSIDRINSDQTMTFFLSINEANGTVYSLKSFDFESLKTFQFFVVAKDSGTPSLSSNVTVNVFILDQNDNVPVILYPVSANGSAEGVEEIPRNVNAGHLVTKVRAYDADIGYNGWLLFSLQEVSDHSLFGLDRYTGQIRTLRSFTETDEAQHKLLILVKDNGNVSLSATATVIVKVVEPKEAFAASDVKNTVKDEEENNVTFYLMITLGSVSVLFVISIIVLIIMQCSKSTDYSSKYLQDTNYDGTLCHSIQYRSGDKRYMLVGPRMSIGSTIVPGSNGNTLVIPDRRRRDSGQVRCSFNNNSYFYKFARVCMPGPFNSAPGGPVSCRVSPNPNQTDLIKVIKVFRTI